MLFYQWTFKSAFYLHLLFILLSPWLYSMIAFTELTNGHSNIPQQELFLTSLTAEPVLLHASLCHRSKTDWQLTLQLSVWIGTSISEYFQSSGLVGIFIGFEICYILVNVNFLIIHLKFPFRLMPLHLFIYNYITSI